MFLCLAPVIIGIAMLFVFFLNYKENPIWRNRQLSMLEVGEIRWLMGSVKAGPGHRIAVVKEIDAKKRRIIFDEYGLQANGQYELLTENVNYSYYDFFNFTNGEPVWKDNVLS